MNLQRRVKEVYEEKAPSVVRVKAAFESPEQSEEEPQLTLKIGTGFFISRAGHVLTNASVAHNAQRVWIEYQGGVFAAELIGSDPETNLSLLELITVPDNFGYLSIPGSDENAAIGSMVMSISCPLEFAPSPTLGMISGVESEFAQRRFQTSYMRTNIPADPGEGGSPVFFLNGSLAGIIVASLPEIRSSYILPARAILRIRDDLLFSGSVSYGWIGVEGLQERAGGGVLIEGVIPETPAAEAGLKPGDILVSIGEKEIRSERDARDASFFHRVGEFMEIKVRRDGVVHEYPVKVIARPGASVEGEGLPDVDSGTGEQALPGRGFPAGPAFPSEPE
ncbi:MAG: S1C family serine protease [Opitutales bacterium]